MSLPIVAIVGRPNVGKSSLMNCLAGKRISIVAPTPGVTRDRVSFTCTMGMGENTRYFELLDTGGMGIEDADKLTDDVEAQIAFGIRTAALILFVVDAREGITTLDRHVAQKLRRQNVPVVLIANKVDRPGQISSEVAEMVRLGFGDPLAVSAMHNQGIHKLFEVLEEKLKDTASSVPPEPVMKLAVVGKRNAGKSTLINSLAGEQRVIVSSVPGTTRDSVDVTIDLDGKKLTLIDTAGVRKRKSLDGDIEFYSYHRAMRSIRRADVVAFMIDASTPISQVDKNLAGIIAENFKPVVLVVNKWDLAKDQADMDSYAEYLATSFPSLTYAPIALTTAKDGTNLKQTVDLAKELYHQSNLRMPTWEINKAVQDILTLRGPSQKSGRPRPKIFYASQIDTAPPTIVCFVNSAKSFDLTYERFLLNQLRERLPFSEVPIRLFFRTRKSIYKDKDKQE